MKKEVAAKKLVSKVAVPGKPAASMAELLEKTGYNVPSFTYGSIVEGKIVSIAHNEILVDVGAKAEGIIAGRELEENPGLWKTLKVGDTLAAFVVQSENDQGYLVLSLRKAYPQQRWGELETLYEKDELVEVLITDFTKGGFLVDAGVPGFIPLSQLSRKNAKQLQSGHGDLPEKAKFLIGRRLTVKIIEMDRALNRLVFSEKEVLSEEERKMREEFLLSLKPGQIVTGTITGIMPFGFFVELGTPINEEGVSFSIEGMVHQSEISWEKSGRIGEQYKVGDVVSAKVLDVEPAVGRVSLSIRQTKENPWTGVGERYVVGSVVEGEVVKIVPFGAFVRLEKGVEALIHVTETTGPLKVGEKVKAMVLDVNPNEQRLALSLKKMVKPAEGAASAGHPTPTPRVEKKTGETPKSEPPIK